MFLVLIENGEAFSVHVDSLLEFLDMRAEGGTRLLADYGHGIGPALTDVTEFTMIEALLEAQKLRTESGMGMIAAA